MRKSVVCGLLLSMLPLAGAMAAPVDQWPSEAQQLRKDHVVPGSALERLIQDNQDFSLLRPDERNDKIGIPAWLRVLYRKAHPEVTYSAKDPSGGYPLALKEVYEWMRSHQDLLPGLPDADVPPPILRASVGSNLRISGAQTSSRSESDIRINFWNPTKVIGSSNNISSSGTQAQFYSSDSGATWGQTSLPLASGDAFNSDPTVDWTSDGTAWSMTMGINSAGTTLKVRSYKSTTSGATWTLDNTVSGTQTNTDKEQLWVDHSATSSFKDNIYVCWHNGNPAYVNRRTGPAGSWGSPIQISGSETTGTAIGCDVKTNSAGDVFVFFPDTGSSKIYYVKSTNGGTSWSAAAAAATTFDSYDIGVPAFSSRRELIYATGGAYKSGSTNNVYVAYNDLTGASGCTAPANEPGTNASSTCKTRIWVARSTDGGATWSKAMINNQSSLNDQFNPWLAVDETTGRVSVMYYDTVNDSTRKKTDVYYQSSTDGGVTWSTATKVTTAMTDETAASADSGNQYGDYNGMSGYNNVFYPSWTDRRNNAKEEIWTASVTESSSCTPPSAPTGVSATAASQTQNNLSWTAASGATEYHILRSTTSGGPYTQVGTATGTTFSDTGLTCNTAYFYVVRAATGPTCESGNSSQASATTQACPTCTPPAAPTGVTATAAGQTQNNLSWTAASGATEYHILRSTTSGGPYTQVGTATGTTFSDTGLTCNTTYYYVVRAATSATCESGNSSQASATTNVCTGCTTTTLYSHNFDSATGLDGWSTGTFVSGGSTADWRGVQTCTAHSGTKIFRFGGSSSCTAAYGNNEFAFAQPNGTGGITFGAAANTSRLSFWHRRGFESTFDGGTIAVSVDGTNYTFVPASAIISGAYNGTTSTACPPTGAGGVSVYTGSSSTFTNTVVDLDKACNAATGGTSGCAGKAVRIAFTTITDCSTTSSGWFLDDVTVTACQ